MNIELSNLQAFVAVAELGSFHAAAEALHLSQPALSRRISNLEDALGTRLFDRTTRRVSLTLLGRELSHKARFLLNEVESSLLGIRDLTDVWKSEVVVACVPSVVRYFLAPVLLRYHERYRKIRVRILDEGANECLSSVMNGKAEFGLNFIGSQETDVEFESMLHEPFVLACRRDDPISRKHSVTWAELAGQPFITVSKSTGIRLVLDLALADVPGRPIWTYEVQHVSMLPAMVEAGLGVAAVPRLAIADRPNSPLTGVPLVNPVVTRTLGLIRRRSRSLSPAAQQLYTMIAQTRQNTGEADSTVLEPVAD
jgi:DNA-binding transcriptional LysR family regulator